ncbi:hypothetical protein [Flavobacterium terrisoli]|uniref:hypothetical protein n=1 Tax=Flavobacterium terrisoli TaxID=3242195 RepID=UPI0025437084|nr:hypothetical protein [Flavobacterium buctense]
MKALFLVIFSFLSISFYGQNDTLSVVRHTENDMVTPKDLKVIYRGISNELFIDVPNSKSFKVSGDFITKKDKNIYKLNPGAGFEATIFIDIVLKNNLKKSERHILK